MIDIKDKFWFKLSEDLIWKKKPLKLYSKNKSNNYNWYPDGLINVFENTILNNLDQNLGDKKAIITVGLDEKFKFYTYKDLDILVNSFCNFLKPKIKNIKNPKIMIHSSASIYSAISMLSCAKMGIHFSVIFEDLEYFAIRNRVKLFKPNFLLTSFSKEKFKEKFLKKIISKKKIFYLKDFNLSTKNIKNSKTIHFLANKDFFTLFTSGSTGQPKGIVHSTAGYLAYAKYTCKNQFGMKNNSIVLTASDAGWINGHTYALFGPLSLGATTVLLESPMLLTNIDIFKKILDLQVSILYLPVTLIRILKALNSNLKIKNNFLKTLGSMGEPLAENVGKWYSAAFSLSKKAIINTYFQTETGGIISSPTYVDKTKNVPHGSVGKVSTTSIKMNNLDKNTKEIIIKTPWPGMMKRILNKSSEWKKYWTKENNFKLFDIGTVKSGNLYIHGRVDDVMNIRGHRLGSEELESVVLKNDYIQECSAVLIDDYLEGSVVVLFIVAKKEINESIIEKCIFDNFGSFAVPKKIFKVKELPKTRSGKILRRLLRTMLENSNIKDKKIFGDTSTMINPKSIQDIIKVITNE